MLKKSDGLAVCGGAEQLPFKDSCFDCVVSLTALHHADLSKAISEINRVAKPNADIAISFLKQAANFAEAKRLLFGWREVDAGVDTIFLNK